MLGVPKKHGLWLASPKRDWSRGLMIFVFGHSVWGVNDGYVSLPKGSQVGFYNDAGENMNAQRAKNMIWDIEDLETPENITPEFKSVQNLTLLRAPEHLGNVRAAFESANRKNKAIPIVTTDSKYGVTLSTVVDTFPNKYIIWLGCRGMQII
ncbi:putative adhesin [Andreprevotia chitinilytica]|uniref:putative adhesin n=1 Tax=Andreprevotia chitinilytica TaxID=396808 RepID=UPI00054D9192|nr:hypothetical protein [Andreprevotia chitinilytica]